MAAVAAATRNVAMSTAGGRGLAAAVGELAWPGRWHGRPSGFGHLATDQSLNSKFETGIFRVSKNHEKFWSHRVDQGEQLSFLVKLQNRNWFWIKNSEKFLNLIWILKGFKHFGKIPKIHQNYIFTWPTQI
jgi:hypothetical protein